MITIGKSKIITIDGMSRLCANITIDSRCISLWFAVGTLQKNYLSAGRADAFVLALLPTAMREGHELICEDTLSAQLKYQLEEYLIPALSLAEEPSFYHMIRIAAPLATEQYPNQKAVGVSFCREDDYLYTSLCHGEKSEYPLTHILVFNTDTPAEAPNETFFSDNCQKAVHFAKEQHLEMVYVNTNLAEILPENPAEVSSFRNIACALALQGLLSVYLLPAGISAKEFQLDLKHCTCYELLTTSCSSTESMTIYLSGAELKQEEKMRIVKEKISYLQSLPASATDGIRHTKQTIVVGKPYIKHINNTVRLCAPIKLHGKENTLWFEVKAKYAPYLTTDRSDAFVTALLTTAMREETNIICEFPVTKRLLYQINQYLIPIMASNMEEYHYITVQAETTENTLDCCKAVGTGWTGGVDSMFTVQQNRHEPEESPYKLTHLMITSNGAIEGDNPSDTLDKMVIKAEKGIIPELGIEMVSINSNLQELLPENFRAVVSIRHSAVILALQKLFGVFLISSSYTFSQIHFIEDNIGHYEPFVLNCLATDHTTFYSAGSPFSRIQKLQQLSDFPLAEKYLHPCIYALKENNCGICDKCIRTQSALYVIGTLDRFSKVFDIKQFEKNKDSYLAQVIMQSKKQQLCAEIIDMSEKQKVNISGAKRQAQQLLLRNTLQKWKKRILAKLK